MSPKRNAKDPSASVLGANKRKMMQSPKDDQVWMPSTVQPPAAHDAISTKETNDRPDSKAEASSSMKSSQVHKTGNSEWWAVILAGNDRGIKEYNVRVKEDTGTRVNWIHPDIVKRCELDSQVMTRPPQWFQDMHGKKSKYEKCIKITWVGRRKNSFEEVFFVSDPRAPIEMVLGEEFVNEYGRAGEVCADEPKIQDARMFVATKLTKKEKQKMDENSAAHEKLSAQVIAQSKSKAGSSSRRIAGESKSKSSSSEKKERSSKDIKRSC